MRPVDKGEEPKQKYSKYQDAEKLLEERIGAYCSFCELPIVHVPEVEHREAKAAGGERLAWENLLLSCKYCNTRKGRKVAAGEKGLYLWADEDDTFHAFTYVKGIPGINRDYLKGKGNGMEQRAVNLFQLVQLDHLPRPRERDRRWNQRMEAYNLAVESLGDWKRIKEQEDKESYLKQTLRLARSVGFFSVWMEVFKGHKDVQKRLVEEFEGTKREYFDDILNS